MKQQTTTMRDAAGSEGDMSPCREVTAEEVAHYQEFGWVKLKGFIRPAMVRTLLERARGKMGDDADSNPSYGGGIEYFNAEFGCGLGNPGTRELFHGLGRGAKALMKRASGVGVRYYQDIFVPKLPSARKSRHAGNGPTSFHQDFITFAVDRTGGMTFWIPLEAYGPDSGTMSFISGSSRLGGLGDYRTYGGDIRDVYPELRDLSMSEAMSYEVGDITVHSHLTVHGSGANLTDRPRWAYLVIIQPADIHWTGQPCPNFDHSGMTPWQPFDDERFPKLG